MAHTFRTKAGFLLLLGLTACPVGQPLARASSVAPMPVARLADHAGQVIVGRVSAIRSYWADNPRRIESEITLEGVEYLKGRLADSTDRFSLIFPGGEIEDYRMSICCAPELRVGEKWLLFLLPTYHTHPVVGVFQGAFLIQPDDNGVERMATRTHGRATPVAGIGPDGFVQLAAGSPADIHEHIHEQLVAAHNLRVQTPAAQPAAAAVSYADFVSQLTPILSASRAHALAGPAGKPAPVAQPAVPLQLSAFEQRRRAAQGAVDPATPVRGADQAKPINSDNAVAPSKESPK